MTAIDTAIARIEINAGAFVARKHRIATDTRIIWLKALAASLDTPITASGVAGAAQVFTALASADNARRVRIGALITARIGQLDGNHSCVRIGLAKAAGIRRSTTKGNRMATLRIGDLVRVDQTSEILTLICIDGEDAWLRDDVGNKLEHRLEDLVSANADDAAQFHVENRRVA